MQKNVNTIETIVNTFLKGRLPMYDKNNITKGNQLSAAGTQLAEISVSRRRGPGVKVENAVRTMK